MGYLLYKIFIFGHLIAFFGASLHPVLLSANCGQTMGVQQHTEFPSHTRDRSPNDNFNLCLEVTTTP